jgi:hypothetical protein
VPMLDRADTAALVLLVLAGVEAAIFIVLFPNLIPHSYSLLKFFVVTAPVYLYALYWAFSLRHALAVRLYRNQALGIGLITLAIWFTLATTSLNPTPLQLYTVFYQGSFVLLFIVLFYWIDASLLAFRRIDPLLRDTFHWSKLRFPLWTVNITLWGILFSITGYAVISDDIGLMNQVNTSFNNPLLNFLLPFIVFIPIICAIIFLPTIAIRAKWDKPLRRHFAWFALFAVLLPGILTNSVEIEAVAILGVAIALYKSAKALVPLNRISPAEMAPKTEPSP